jgi:hypothetical protein
MSNDYAANYAAEEARFSAQCKLRQEITQRVLGHRDLFALKLVNGRVVIDKAASLKRYREVMKALAREGGTTMVIPYDEKPL